MTTAEELERLLALGAQRADVGQNPDVSWGVLSDPEGNEFCLLSRSVQDAHRRRHQPCRSGILTETGVTDLHRPIR